MNFSIFIDSISTHSEPIRTLLTMVAFVILFGGFALGSTYSFWNPEEMFRRMVMVILITIAIALLPSAVQELDYFIRVMVKEELKVDTSLVHEKVKDVLLDPQLSFWSILVGVVLGEAILSTIVLLMGLVALAIQSGVHLVQNFFVAMAVMVSPLMLAWLAMNFSRSLGLRYIMGLLGILSWPIGLALADVITLSLIDQLDQFSLISDSDGFVDRALGKLLSPLKDAWVMLLLSLWLIFSSFIMPWIMSGLFKADGLIGAPLLKALSGAISAGTAAGLAPMATAAALRSSGGSAGGSSQSGGVSLGRAALIGAAAAPIGFAEGAMRGGQGSPMTSLVSSGIVAAMTARNPKKNPSGEPREGGGSPNPSNAKALYEEMKQKSDT